MVTEAPQTENPAWLDWLIPMGGVVMLVFLLVMVLMLIVMVVLVIKVSKL